MDTRWRGRSRPLPPEVAWAIGRYSAVLAVDGSTLDALLRKVGLLAERADTPLAGRMTALLHIGSRLPAHLGYEPDPQAHDQRAWGRILAALPAGALLLLRLVGGAGRDRRLARRGRLRHVAGTGSKAFPACDAPSRATLVPRTYTFQLSVTRPRLETINLLAQALAPTAEQRAAVYSLGSVLSRRAGSSPAR